MDISGITITHPERVVFPDSGVTKAEVAHYYSEIVPLLLPHIADRPLSVVRCPEGRQKTCFFQKHRGMGMPGAVGSVKVPGDEDTYLTVNSVEGVVSLAQFGVLEIHPWLSRNDWLERPDVMIFDFDPAEEVAWEAVLEGAFLLRDLLLNLGLESFPKLTGGKGLHVVIPMKRQLDFSAVKPAAKVISERLRSQNPDRFVTVASKAKRKGKIFIDYLRNGQGATAVAPYSLRARSRAPVTVPVCWEDIRRDLKPDAFTIGALPQLLSRGEPWPGFFLSKQSLTKHMLRELEGWRNS